ncbi:MAG: chorismate-binding protein [Planctomycetota bacterium]|nr:chorismate-binding protein [Planctomycetota bacterium]
MNQSKQTARGSESGIDRRFVQPGADVFAGVAARERAKLGPGETLVFPLTLRLLADQLTPVLAYRRLVAPDERTAPSFLFESVEGGERQGRYSILSSRPTLEVVAYQNEVRVHAHDPEAWPEGDARLHEPRPLEVPRRLTRRHRMARFEGRELGSPLPACLLGGWVGFAGYDSVRYAEAEKLPFSAAPRDDRGLPDLHFGFYDGVVIFDNVEKTVVLVQLAMIPPGADAGACFERAASKLERRAAEIQAQARPMPSGCMPPAGSIDLASAGSRATSNFTREQHAAMLDKALGYIRAGDIFQVVLGQRFERESSVDPFDVYRALRAVNPSPYMVYAQGEGTILIASSPEILCRVRRKAGRDGREAMVVTNRPLAGTRRRGATPEEDAAMEKELLADPKERAEHTMLVDLGRNDLGMVCRAGTVSLDAVMEIERYSHVMHISSTVTGELRDGLDCWDALAATLPVGTISGAPKIRAMQVIDELEPVKRGPYGGGIGYVGVDGQMDVALALRTIVVPVAKRRGSKWVYHLQASGGIVADSKAQPEFEETVNKAAAMSRAVEVAERAFGTVQ